MFDLASIRTWTQYLDKLVLYVLNRRIPDSFEQNPAEMLDIEAVLAQTTVNLEKTAVSNLIAPGEHKVCLNTLCGELCCQVRVRLAVNPRAPLLLYHHGFAEVPYTSTWQKLFPKNNPFPAHLVAVQAPYHTEMNTAVQSVFSSLQHILQTFAGSIRIMQLLQAVFEENEAAFTVASGLSWGGITSILYGGVFNHVRAVVPLYASPNLAQLLWDNAEMFGRDLPFSHETLSHYLDFTSYYERLESQRVFAVLGSNDLFFRKDHHATVYADEALVMTSSNHVGAVTQNRTLLRQNLHDALDFAANNPLNPAVARTTSHEFSRQAA